MSLPNSLHIPSLAGGIAAIDGITEIDTGLRSVQSFVASLISALVPNVMISCTPSSTPGQTVKYDVCLAAAKTLGVAPTGTITTVTVANLADTDYFTIDDGSNTANVFEYDKAGNGVTTGRVAIDVHLLSTADEVRDATIVAINRQHTLGLLDITAVSGGAATVNLAHDFMGVGGNVAVTENVTNGGFAVTGMSTGVTPVSGLVQSGSVSWIAIGA